MGRPVERKVYAATIGAGAGTVVSDFVLWGIDQIWWPSEEVDIPLPVAGFSSLLVTVGMTFLAGWWAKHGADGYLEHEV